MKRTTLAIDDHLLRLLKERAAKAGRSLQAEANDLLRQALARRPVAKRFRLALDGWRAKEREGVDILDRDKLFDLMNGS
jgi:plasmid stability protein